MNTECTLTAVNADFKESHVARSCLGLAQMFRVLHSSPQSGRLLFTTLHLALPSNDSSLSITATLLSCLPFTTPITLPLWLPSSRVCMCYLPSTA